VPARASASEAGSAVNISTGSSAVRVSVSIVQRVTVSIVQRVTVNGAVRVSVDQRLTVEQRVDVTGRHAIGCPVAGGHGERRRWQRGPSDRWRSGIHIGPNGRKAAKYIDGPDDQRNVGHASDPRWLARHRLFRPSPNEPISTELFAAVGGRLPADRFRVAARQVPRAVGSTRNRWFANHRCD